MRRRTFVAMLGGAAAWPAVTHAQQTQRMKRIAIVHPTEKREDMTIHGRRTFKAYFEELDRLGYIEGRNVVIERYSGLGQTDRYGDLARAVVAGQPDLIVSIGSQVTLQLRSLGTPIPIVAATTDPVVIGLVTSLARPSGTITGVSVDAGVEVWGKRFQLLAQAAGNLTKVRFLAASYSHWQLAIGPVSEAAQKTGTPIGALFLDGNINPAAYERVFDAMERDQVDGLLLSDSAEHLTSRVLIAELAKRHRLPTIYPHRDYVEVGGLMAYSVDLASVYHRVADVTDQVLRGAKPGDIPFYQQIKYELVLNQGAAKSLGLAFPALLLSVADDVIE